MRVCLWDGCDMPRVARDYCRRHYNRLHKRGAFPAREKDPVKRFWSHVDRAGECWLWMRARDPNGYGRVGWYGAVRLAHRVAYELERGEIPGGLPLDHLCRTPACVRPDHLEPVQTRENTARGRHPSAVALRTDRCIRGHAFDQENTRIWRGERICRACTKLRKSRYPYKPRPQPSRVQTVTTVCAECGRGFSYPKVRRVRTICSDECKLARHNRANRDYKRLKRAG